MRLLTRRILSELLRVFLAGAGGGLGLASLLVVLDLVREGFPVTVSLRLAFLGLVGLAGYALPVALLGAVTAVASRLASDREWHSALWSGIAPRSLAIPFWVLGVAGALLSLPQQLAAIPASRRAQAGGAAIAQAQIPFESILGGTHSLPPLDAGGGQRILIWFGRCEDGVLHDAVLFRTEDETCRMVMEAKRIVLRFEPFSVQRPASSGATGPGDLILAPEEATVVALRSDGRIGRPTTFERADPVPLPVQAPHEGRSDPRALAWGDLLCALRGGGGRAEGVGRAVLLCEISSRLADCAAPLAFVAIGLPLGLALAHPNRLVPFGAALLAVFAVYYPLSAAGRALGAAGGPVAAVLAPWLGVAAFLSVPVVRLLCRRGTA